MESLVEAHLQGKENPFIAEKEFGGAIPVQRGHCFSLAASSLGRKRSLSSCWPLLLLQGVRASLAGLLTLFSWDFCLLIFYNRHYPEENFGLERELPAWLPISPVALFHCVFPLPLINMPTSLLSSRVMKIPTATSSSHSLSLAGDLHKNCFRHTDFFFFSSCLLLQTLASAFPVYFLEILTPLD